MNNEADQHSAPLSQTHNHLPLPTLNTPYKLGVSALLIAGLCLFLSGWAYALIRVYGNSDSGSLGVALGMLAMDDSAGFGWLFSVHATSTVLLIVPSLYLFSKTSLRRRMQALLRYAVVLLVALDLSAWLYTPHCSETNIYVGLIGGLSAIGLSALALFPLFQMWVYRRWEPLDGKTKRVVLVGGGFGGLYAALGLHKELGYHPKLEITLLDQNNYFLFPPLLPSASTGTIEYRQVSYPFRRIFETTNIKFTRMRVTNIDQVNKQVHGVTPGQDEMLSLPYDVLVFAPGAVTQTFGTPGAEKFALCMRELNDAITLRDRIIDLFEEAASSPSSEHREGLLSFIVVGAGPTGIETATEIQDLIHHVLLKRYPEIDRSMPKVAIIQSGDRVLPGWDLAIAKNAEKQLRRMGIDLRLGSRVAEVTADGVTLKDGQHLHSHTVVWCAGVKPSPLVEASGLTAESSGKIAVTQTLQSTEHDHVFVLGDVAHYVDPRTNKALPALAQVAFQQGQLTGRNIARLLSGQTLRQFKYFDYGSLVSVGEHYAAVKMMGVSFSGVLAWFAWRSLYLAKLPGWGNRIRVVLDWTLDLLIERSITQTRVTSLSHTTETRAINKLSRSQTAVVPGAEGVHSAEVPHVEPEKRESTRIEAQIGHASL